MLQILFVITVTCFSSFGLGSPIRPVAIFSSDERDLHKYAAVLAATEPYRLQRDNEIITAINPIKFWFHKIRGTKFNDPASLIRLENKAIDNACTTYEKKADEIVRSYGLTVNTFNTLSRKITKDASLKHRILLQAYYYRIAADLEDNLKSGLPILNANLGSAEGFRLPASGVSGSADSTEADLNKPKIYRFAKALRAIEDERLRQRTQLKTELNLPALPSNMCDPSQLPAMSRSIQTACSEFPKLAGQIVTQYGLATDEFNALDQKMKKDFLFRLKVRHEVDKVDKLRKKYQNSSKK